MEDTPIKRNHRRGRLSVTGDGKSKSADKKATIVQEMTPRIRWNPSNLPENTSHTANITRKVRKKPALNRFGCEEGEVSLPGLG